MNIRQIQQAFMMLILSIIFSTNAIAMYAPSIGRFCSRDPIGYDGGKTPLDDSDDLEAFAPVTGLNLYQKYFEISRVDPSGLTAMCTTIPESSGKGNPKTRCLKYKPYNGRFVKKVCVRQQCFFRCYCPGNDNCPRRPYKDPTCQRDHGVEMAYVSTEADRGIIPWLLGAGAPRCELLESTIAKKFDCDG